MLDLWKRDWFVKTVNWMRKWKWFDENIYGRSINMEDFVRNPAEVFRDKYFALHDCKGYSILSLRFGFIRYRPELFDGYITKIKKYFRPVPISISAVKPTYREIESDKFRVRIKDLVLFDGSWFDTFYSKYMNAFLAFQFILSRKKFWLLPGICFVLRFWPTMYFQAGVGWAPEGRQGKATDSEFKQSTFYLKCRIGHYKKELEWNPGLEVYGYYEGLC